MKDDGARSGSASQLASHKLAQNSAWNIIALFATIAVHFITVPVVIGRIGLGEFGNAGLVLALWAPLFLVGTVTGQALTRELGVRVGDHDPAESRRLTESASYLWVLSTVFGWLTLALAGPALLSRLVGGGGAAHWRWDIAIAGLGWAAQQGSLMLQGASTAYQSYRIVALVTFVTAGVTIATILLCSRAVPSADGYLAGLTAGSVFGLLLWLVVARATGSASFIMPRMHRTELHSLFSFGKWQGLAQLTGTLANQIDRYVLGAVASPVIVGQYNAAKRPQEAAYSVASKLAEVLFPYFASTARADADRQAKLYLLASWAVMACGAMVLGPAISLADPIMHIWLGPEVANGGAQLMRTLVLAGLLGCGSNVFAFYLMGVGKNAPFALTAVLYSCLAIILSIVIIRHWGGYAAGAGLVIASMVRMLVSLGILRHSILRNIHVGDLAMSSISPLLVGAVGAYLWRLVPVIDGINSWAGVMLAYLGISLSIGVGVCLVTATTPFGRGAIVWMAGVLQRSILPRGVA